MKEGMKTSKKSLNKPRTRDSFETKRCHTGEKQRNREKKKQRIKNE